MLLQSLQSTPSTSQRGVTGFTRQISQSLSSTHSILTEYRLVYPYQTENIIKYRYNYELQPDRVLQQNLSEPLHLAKTHNIRSTALPSFTHVNKLHLMPFSRTSLEPTLKTASVMNPLHVTSPKAESKPIPEYLSISKIENLLSTVRPTSLERRSISTQVIDEILHGYQYESREKTFLSTRVVDEILHSYQHETRDTYIPPVTSTYELVSSIMLPSISFRYRAVTLRLPIYPCFRIAVVYRMFIIETINRIIEALYYKPIFITKAYKFLIDLQNLVAKFRYVQAGDYVLHTDHNLFVDFCNLFFQFATQLATDLFPEDVEVHAKLSNLGSAIGKLRKVYVFDIVSARDHNTVVDAILKMREFLSKVREKLGLPT